MRKNILLAAVATALTTVGLQYACAAITSFGWRYLPLSLGFERLLGTSEMIAWVATAALGLGAGLIAAHMRTSAAVALLAAAGAGTALGLLGIALHANDLMTLVSEMPFVAIAKPAGIPMIGLSAWTGIVLMRRRQSQPA